MPVYHLVLVDMDGEADDPEGCERPDLGSAVEVAIAAARDIMAAGVRAGRLDLDQRIEIRDRGASTLAVVEFMSALDIGLPRSKPAVPTLHMVRERAMPSNDAN